MSRFNSRKRGFTLIEILIVVIILGILAAIVIPQFANASKDARNSNLLSTVQTLRSQIQLYKLQHGDLLPDLETDWTPMTTVTSYGSATNLGPYMQSVPVNPLVTTAPLTASIVKEGNGSAAVTGCGFVYDFQSGNGTGRIWGVDDSGNIVTP
jgi:general secretion pathway protein G